jgi:hypothetical protein
MAKNICENPIALVTDDCFTQQGVEVTFPTLRNSFQQVIDEVRAKAGGPIVVLPARGPGMGPQPQGPRNTVAPGMAAPRATGRPATKPGEPLPQGQPTGEPRKPPPTA